MTAAQSEAAPPTDTGVEGNSRLTSSLGLILLVMLAVEGATVLNVRGMLTLHMYLGLMLIPPVLLKSATTFYRFVRYYSAAEPYVRKGPPHIVLRVLGPLVVLSSIVLLGTGLALIVASDSQRGTWLNLHQASFIVWLVVMSLHVLGHIVDASQTSAAEFRRKEYSRGRTVRLAAIALSLLAGVGLATALWPSEQSASRTQFGHFHDFRRDDR
jgi:hypothetical protein